MVAGVGDANYRLAFCIANRPPLDDFPSRRHIAPLLPGQLQHIVVNTSNHWRKLFNVYAKFLYALGPEPGWPNRWQMYRDQQLLQSGSGVALLFSPPPVESRALHLVAGKGYARTLNLPGLVWLDACFAVAPEHRIVVTPYLDYRQLSDARIECLVDIIRRYGLL